MSVRTPYNSFLTFPHFFLRYHPSALKKKQGDAKRHNQNGAA
jgi:hypothetical protein